jgi:hypothetical protein
MPIKLKINTKLIYWVFVLSLFFVFTVQAKTEFLIGLTAQSIRSATTEEVEIGLNYYLNNISKNKNYGLQIKVFQSEDQLNQSLSERKLIGFFGTPLMFFQNKDEFDSNLLFSPVLSNKVLQRYLLLVRNDSGITQIKQLNSAQLSYCLADEVGIIYLHKLMKDKKLGSPNTFFSKLSIKKNPNLAISSVFFKETQATIVLESDFIVAAELNPQLKKQLMVIDTSPELITNLLAIKKDQNGVMTPTDFETSVLNLGEALQGKKLLKSFNFGEMRKIKLEDLNSVQELIYNVKENKGLPR